MAKDISFILGIVVLLLLIRDGVSDVHPLVIAPEPIVEEGFDSCLIKTALSQTGFKEDEGSNRGAAIRMYMKVVGLPDGHYWCAGYVCWLMEHCGYDHPASGWAADVGGFNVIYEKGKGSFPEMREALVFDLYYKSLGRVGHTGVITGMTNSKIKSNEGNSSGGKGRNGDGVYNLMRSKSSVNRVSDYGKRKNNNSGSNSSVLGSFDHLAVQGKARRYTSKS